MKYNTIKLNDIANSESGINISIWCQGCPHYCKGCFNKETWDFNKGIEYTEETFQYICENINNYGVERNLSILGGDGLCPQNVDGVIDLCKSFKQKYPNKKIYLWTGYTIEEFTDKQKEVLQYLDILIDGKFVEELKNISLKLRGSSNQRIILVQESLKQNKIIIKKE